MHLEALEQVLEKQRFNQKVPVFTNENEYWLQLQIRAINPDYFLDSLMLLLKAYKKNHPDAYQLKLVMLMDKITDAVSLCRLENTKTVNILFQSMQTVYAEYSSLQRNDKNQYYPSSFIQAFYTKIKHNVNHPQYNVYVEKLSSFIAVTLPQNEIDNWFETFIADNLVFDNKPDLSLLAGKISTSSVKKLFTTAMSYRDNTSYIDLIALLRNRLTKENFDAMTDFILENAKKEGLHLVFSTKLALALGETITQCSPNKFSSLFDLLIEAVDQACGAIKKGYGPESCYPWMSNADSNALYYSVHLPDLFNLLNLMILKLDTRCYFDKRSLEINLQNLAYAFENTPYDSRYNQSTIDTYNKLIKMLPGNLQPLEISSIYDNFPDPIRIYGDRDPKTPAVLDIEDEINEFKTGLFYRPSIKAVIQKLTKIKNSEKAISSLLSILNQHDAAQILSELDANTLFFYNIASVFTPKIINPVEKEENGIIQIAQTTHSTETVNQSVIETKPNDPASASSQQNQDFSKSHDLKYPEDEANELRFQLQILFQSDFSFMTRHGTKPAGVLALSKIYQQHKDSPAEILIDSLKKEIQPYRSSTLTKHCYNILRGRHPKVDSLYESIGAINPRNESTLTYALRYVEQLISEITAHQQKQTAISQGRFYSLKR